MSDAYCFPSFYYLITKKIQQECLFLLYLFNTLSTSDIVVKLSDPGRPGVFCPSEDEKDSQLVMLLMPMAIIDF